MKLATSVAVLASAGAAVAAPLEKRAVTDAQILNYALTLEHLEATFYTQYLAKYNNASFTAAGFADQLYQKFIETRDDEQEHVTFLTGALKSAGATPVAACTYDFNVTSVTDFVNVAAILEGVGVSAYLGAAADIASKAYLTAAGSILTVEARHSAFIRNALELTPAPAPFDVPLDFDQVYTLAAGFIKSCPKSNPALPVKAFPMMTSNAAAPVKPGTRVTLSTGTARLVPNKGAKIYAAWITVQGPIYTPVTANALHNQFTVTVPNGVAGQSYVILQNCNTGITDASTLAGPAIVPVVSQYTGVA